MNTEKTKGQATTKASMSEKTARKNMRIGILSSELRHGRNSATRNNSFEEVWEEIREMLLLNPGL